MTFSTLQTLTSNQSSPVAEVPIIPGDDASVAKLIADRYTSQGLDPRAAYDNPDDALNDFGGIQEFM